MSRVRVTVMCRVRFRRKLWCGLELGFEFRMRDHVRIRLTVRVPCGFHVAEGDKEDMGFGCMIV